MRLIVRPLQCRYQPSEKKVSILPTQPPHGADINMRTVRRRRYLCVQTFHSDDMYGRCGHRWSRAKRSNDVYTYVVHVCFVTSRRLPNVCYPIRNDDEMCPSTPRQRA